jgi:hypothetical protein
MFWCTAGHILWSGTRHVHYATMRMRLERYNNKYRDTIVLPVSAVKNNPDIIWMERDEIRYRGKMFDIKSATQKDGLMIFAGHYDEMDDELFKLLDSLFDNEADRANKNKLPLWYCEAVLQPADLYTRGLYEYTLLRRIVFNVPCIPLHEPSAPFLPPATVA